MIIEDIENILTLFATIVGLMGCLFRFIKAPKRGYLYLIVFFLCSLLSDYYWTVYSLVMHSYPEISEFLAYLGWNISYPVLFVAVLHLRAEGSKRYFHPVILWPVLTNAAQFVLYIQFGGIFNNIWQVGFSTLIMILCMQQIMYWLRYRKSGAGVPHLAIVVLLYMITEYGMWTSSCFDWPGEFRNPYLYLSVLAALSLVTFAWGAEKDCGGGETEDPGSSWTEFRFQTLVQAIASVAICGASAGGFVVAARIKDSMAEKYAGSAASNSIITILFGISIVLILFILLLIFLITRRYHGAQESRSGTDAVRHSRFSLFFTIVITMALMVFVVVYNSRVLYRASVTGIYEDGKDVVTATATELENYLTIAEATLRVTADTVDMMVQNGESAQVILEYLTNQTEKQSQQFDESFTGIYAYVGGEFMDGSGWVPPEGYEPMSRDWYITAVEANGEVVIVSPYLDAQTGSVVITVAKRIRDGSGAEVFNGHNVVCLDVIVNHVQEVIEQVDIAGKGYGIVVNADGFIVAHRDRAQNGQNFSEVYGQGILDRIVQADYDRFDAMLDDERCTLFVHRIMDQWIAVIVVGNTELFESIYSQLTVNILVSLVIFWLISFFYYFGYRIEQHNSKKIEEMNVQVVSALAEAVDAKDAYTNGHSSRVARYAKMIADRVGYSAAEQNEIYMMGLLHDVGKIGVPDEVITKPGKLTEEEYEIIKQHPVIGSRILESIKERPTLATGARWHHERYGGGGYPEGISGEAIPEAARIIAVADAYDAMTSRRSYRDIMPQEKVRKEIEDGAGTQFDPRFARAMLGLIDEDTTYSMREK